MTTSHPQFGLMCEICHHGLTPDQCAEDTNGQKWDICKGDCARQAGIEERVTTYRTGNHWGVTIVREGDGRCPVSTTGMCLSMTEGFDRCESGECVHHESGGTRDELVAVVVNGDQALAERICALLNRDEDAPPSPLSAPVTAQTGPLGGQDRPDAHSGTEGRIWGEHPAHPTCIDVTNIRAGLPPRSEWMCGPDCPREPERKADQAFPCECEGFRLALRQPPGPDWCYCGHERADHHDRHGPCTREAVMLG